MADITRPGQVGEEDWLAQRRSGAAPPSHAEADAADKARRREASVRALLQQRAALEADVERLTRRLAAAREAALALWTLLGDHGVAVDAGALGLDALLLGDGEASDDEGAGAGSIARRGDHAGVARGGDDEDAAEAEADAWGDVLSEGDGRFAQHVVADLRPHGGANVLCVCALRCTRGAVVAITGGADRRVVASLLIADGVGAAPSSADLSEPTVLFSITLSAPVLRLACHIDGAEDRRVAAMEDLRHGDSGLVVAGCMDGSVHLLHFSFADAHGQDQEPHSVCFLLRPAHVLRDHARYVTRVALSSDGALLATGGADRSCAVYLLPAPHARGKGVDLDGDSAVAAPRRLQQFYFARGAVEAVEWCCEQEAACGAGADAGARARVDTLAVAVRDAHTLYYLRVVRGPAGAAAALAPVLRGGGLGHPQPLLPAPEGEGEGAGAGAACDAAAPRRLLLYRVPLSDDGPRIDCGWAALLRSFGSQAHRQPADKAEAGAEPQSIAAGEAEREAEGESESEGRDDVQGLAEHAHALAAAVAASDRNSGETRGGTNVGDDEGGDAARVRAALRGRHVTSRADGTLDGDASSGRVGAGGRDGAGAGAEPPFIRVGFTVIDLACEPWLLPAPASAGLARSPRLLAAAADSGVVFLLRFGCNTVVRSLVGHGAGGGAQELAATRLAWHPPAPDTGDVESAGRCQYLCATSDGQTRGLGEAAARAWGCSLVVYSVGSGRVAARLGGGSDSGSGGHRGTVKDVAFATASREGAAWPPLMLSAGFDKRCLAWGLLPRRV